MQGIRYAVAAGLTGLALLAGACGGSDQSARNPMYLDPIGLPSGEFYTDSLMAVAYDEDRDGKVDAFEFSHILSIGPTDDDGKFTLDLSEPHQICSKDNVWECYVDSDLDGEIDSWVNPVNVWAINKSQTGLREIYREDIDFDELTAR